MQATCPMKHSCPSQLPSLPDRLLDPTIPADRDLLTSIQGNILQGHGRHYTRLVLFRLSPDCAPEAHQQMLRDLLVDGYVTSALDQYCQARSKNREPNRVFYNFCLTSSGLRRLGHTESGVPHWAPPRHEFLARYPIDFSHGMDRPQHEPWDSGYDDSIDGCWLVACSEESLLAAAVAGLRAWGKLRGIDVTMVEQGTSWRYRGRQREAFGFVDGISMPRYFVPGAQTPAGHVDWTPSRLTDVLIAPEVSPIHAGGSFLVLRKLEQHVQVFRDYEAEIRKVLVHSGDAYLKENAWWIAPVLIVGRRRDGRPAPDALNLPPMAPKLSAAEFNRFDFQTDVAPPTCPFHAHIRRLNPRAPAAGGVDRERIIRSQLVRRSALYDPEGKLRAAARSTPRRWPDSGVGLLFMAFMSDIRAQFNVLTSDWAPSDMFPAAHDGGPDAMIHPSARTNGGSAAKTWTWRGLNFPLPPQIVTPHGGAFFYVPSLCWLGAGGNVARP